MPLLETVTLNSAPVSSFFTTTVAPDTTAPSGSVTVPDSEEVTCPKAVRHIISMNKPTDAIEMGTLLFTIAILHWKGEKSETDLLSPGTASAILMRLKVNPRDNLHQPSARILSVILVPIGRRHLAEGLAAQAGEGVAREVQEIDVVEGVQELAAQFEVDALVDLDFFHDTEIEASELRAVDHHRVRGAIAVHHLDAARAIGRRDVASGGRAEAAIAVSGRRRDVVGPPGIEDDVIRQHINDSVRIVEAQLVLITEFLRRHADQTDVVKTKRITAL